MNVLMSAFLLLFAIEDLREKKISLWLLIIMNLTFVLCGVYQNGVVHSALGIIPGIMLLAFSVLQPLVMGKGDGLVAIAYGAFYGFQKAFIWLALSFLLVSIVGIIVKVLLRKHKLQIPFIPFMGIIHMGMWL